MVLDDRLTGTTEVVTTGYTVPRCAKVDAATKQKRKARRFCIVIKEWAAILHTAHSLQLRSTIGEDHRHVRASSNNHTTIEHQISGIVSIRISTDSKRCSFVEDISSSRVCDGQRPQTSIGIPVSVTTLSNIR